MKEINFLPEWYKSGKRRQAGYRTQYVVLGGIFAIMVVWNFVTARSISKVEAGLAQAAAGQAHAENASQEFAALKTEIAGLQKKTELVKQIDSNINVADILAEMSFLIGKKIVLGKVEFVAEKFVDKQVPQQSSNSVARVAIPKFVEKQALPLGNVRFKVLLNGIAADAGDVAAFICKLEESPYFCQVVLLFSRNAEVKVANYPLLSPNANPGEKPPNAERDIREPDKSIQATEFEISCFLANYREQ